MGILSKIEHLSKGDLLSKIKKTFFLQVFGAIAAFFSNVIIARLLKVEYFGVYSYYISLSRLLIIPTLLGFSTYTLRYYPRAIVEKKWELLRGYDFFAKWITIIISMLFIIIGYVGMKFFGWASASNRDAYLIFLFSLPLFSFINLYIALFQARHKLTPAMLLSNVLVPVILPIIISFCIYILKMRLSITDFAWLYFLTLVFIIIYTLIISQKHKIPELLNVKKEYAIKEWVTTSLPMLFTSSLQYLLMQADVFMIGLMMTTSDVGYYSAAMKVDMVLLFGIQTVNFVEAPIFSKLYTKGDMVGLQNTVTSSAWLIFGFTVATSLPIIFFGRQILGFFGSDFSVAYWPLMILLVCNSFNALSGSVGLLMSMTKHQNEAFYITGASAILCVTLNYFLIKLYGINGAATAICISIIFRNTAMSIFVRRKLGINATVIPF